MPQTKKIITNIFDIYYTKIRFKMLRRGAPRKMLLIAMVVVGMAHVDASPISYTMVVNADGSYTLSNTGT